MNLLTPEFVESFGSVFPRVLYGFLVVASLLLFAYLVIDAAHELYVWWQKQQAKASVRERTAVVAFDLMLERDRVLRQMQAVASSRPRSEPD